MHNEYTGEEMGLIMQNEHATALAQTEITVQCENTQ